jgi:hypothetical protein
MSDHTQKSIDELARRYAELQRRSEERLQALRARLDAIMADETANRPALAHPDEATQLNAAIQHMRKYDDAVAAAISVYHLAAAIDQGESGYPLLHRRNCQ